MVWLSQPRVAEMEWRRATGELPRAGGNRYSAPAFRISNAEKLQTPEAAGSRGGLSSERGEAKAP